MDDDKLSSKSSSFAQLGINLLQNPQDIALIKRLNYVAIADDTNGLVVLSTEGGKLIKVSLKN